VYIHTYMYPEYLYRPGRTSTPQKGKDGTADTLMSGCQSRSGVHFQVLKKRRAKPAEKLYRAPTCRELVVVHVPLVYMSWYRRGTALYS
jgi:hypothetical protein